MCLGVKEFVTPAVWPLPQTLYTYMCLGVKEFVTLRPLPQTLYTYVCLGVKEFVTLRPLPQTLYTYVFGCKGVTSAVRPLVPAVRTVRDSITHSAQMDAHVRVQAAMLVHWTLVHPVVRT